MKPLAPSYKKAAKGILCATLVVAVSACGKSTQTKIENQNAAPTEAKSSLKEGKYTSVENSIKAELTNAEVDAVAHVFQVARDSESLDLNGMPMKKSYDYMEDKEELALGNIKLIVRNLKALANDVRSDRNSSFSNVDEPILETRACNANVDTGEAGSLFISGFLKRNYKKESKPDTTDPKLIREVATLDAVAGATGIAKGCEHSLSGDEENAFTKDLPYPAYPESFSKPYPDNNAPNFEELLKEYNQAYKAHEDLLVQYTNAANKIGDERKKRLQGLTYKVDGQIESRAEFHAEAEAIRSKRNIKAKEFESMLTGVKGKAQAWTSVTGTVTANGIDVEKRTMIPTKIELKDYAVFVEMTRDQMVQIRTVGNNHMLSDEDNVRDIVAFLEPMVKCSGSVIVNGKNLTCQSFTQTLIEEIAVQRVYGQRQY